MVSHCDPTTFRCSVKLGLGLVLLQWIAQMEDVSTGRVESIEDQPDKELTGRVI